MRFSCNTKVKNILVEAFGWSARPIPQYGEWKTLEGRGEIYFSPEKREWEVKLPLGGKKGKSLKDRLFKAVTEVEAMDRWEWEGKFYLDVRVLPHHEGVRAARKCFKEIWEEEGGRPPS